MVDLTKEEAAALLCKSYGLYIEERLKCIDCPNFIKTDNCCSDWKNNWLLLKSGQAKLKAYIGR